MILHKMLYSHRILIKAEWGEIIICANRITGRINRMTWFPEWLPELWVDITYVDFSELIAFHSKEAALEWVVAENARNNY